MKKHILISTTAEIAGYNIDRHLDIVHESIVLGLDFVSEFFGSFTDLAGGRSRRFEEELKELRESLIEEMQRAAMRMGANAMVGFRWMLMS